MNEDNRELSPQRPNEMFATLQTLEHDDLFFLQVTALLDDDLPREELFRIMKALIQTPGSRKRWEATQASARLKRLRGMGLIIRHNRCHPAIREIIARRPIEHKHLELCRQLLRSSFISHDSASDDPEKNRSRALRDFRLALLCHDLETLQKQLPIFHEPPYDPKRRHPFAALILNPFDPDWFRELPLPLQFAALDDAITFSLENLEPTPELDRFIPSAFPANQPGNRPFILLYAHKLLLSGRLPELEALLEAHRELFSGSGFRGALKSLQGDFPAAAESFRRDLDCARSSKTDGQACFDAPIVFFYTLTLGHTQSAAIWDQVQQILAIGREELVYNPYTRDLFLLAEILLDTFRGLASKAREKLAKLEKRPDRSIFTLLTALVSQWINGSLGPAEQNKLNLLITLNQDDFPWITKESQALLQLNRASTDTPEEDKTRTRFLENEDSPLHPLAPAISFAPAWQRTLEALRQLKQQNVPVSAVTRLQAEMRLAWFIDLTPDGDLTLIPKIQRHSEGGWSPGRNLALSRIYDGERFPFFSELDDRLCHLLRRSPNGKGDEFHFELFPALPLLARHPYLFLLGHPEIPACLREEPVAVIITRETENNTLKIRLSPQLGEKEFLVVRAEQNLFIYYLNNPRLLEIAGLFSSRGLTVPASAADEVTRTLEPLSRIAPIYTDTPVLPEKESISARPPDPVVIRLQIYPAGQGLIFTIRVRPLSEQGPSFIPGKGFSHLLTTAAGRTLIVHRDLAQERNYLAELYRICPELRPERENGDGQERHIEDLELCLELLDRLQELQRELEQDNRPQWLVCEWPAGRRLNLKKPAATGSLRLKISPYQNWFIIEGGLKTEENEVIDLLQLLKKIDRGPANFVPLKENQFVAISQELRHRLNQLRFYLSDEEGKLKIHQAAVGVVGEILAGVKGVHCDRLWLERQRRLQNAATYHPEVPTTLKAQLRSYQKEGFNWLARLAHLGFGACLADDMGLGKTIQALALILSRAQAGPVLVVAPTSVCDNWIRECKQFAPSLNPLPFGGTRRQELVESLKPGDLLVCSYTMLQQEQELLCGRTWEIIVLDEAQAIKNMNTKRSRAAMSLKGNFRLITTGTPMENHLGELWNLFNFINPGLLGTLEQFQRRFAQPIEQVKSEEARNHLRRLIQPYILRRTKTQVLKELPPRTEILLKVELSPEERNFYEAVRRQAIANLEETGRKTGNTASNTSIQILAELTRLRLAACNPRLVAPESRIASAKLELFGRVVGDLTSSGHRALVFSQFVKHLALVREYLDRQGISYRYLDGSTPKTKRQIEINAFQEGDSDLFLISLKAGGLGLNLTAADYVIHLDPWWNPAIEDQASDRAHRIGQTRPVTVYRLISRATIEEKIVHLHQEKRNLADQILSTSDSSARFSTAELLELIKRG